ncbi:MAG: RNA-binding S4 domain-containing protein [Gammaproteobacteria bacterium]|jgi:ribosome-associated heat shock protein Hsp15
MDDEALRIDKWLWHTRFFKTRALAAKAVAGGHVHVNGERVKPSRAIRAGDRLEVNRDRLTWRVTVLTLPARRGPAREAEACYHEEEGSRREREALIEALRQDRRSMPRTEGRPDKHTRRQLRRLNRKS